jgi:hypothetical protein
MGIVEDLLAAPGLYAGTVTGEHDHGARAARILVSPLPGGAGVSLDYEVLGASPDASGRSHAEHTVLGTADDGTTVMVVAHTHGDGIAILRETEPGVFDPGDAPVPYPIKIVVSVPRRGRIRHAWWYGRPGEAPAERDVADVELVGD